MLDRRHFVLLPAWLASSLASAAVTAKVPDPKTFESGDLVWPKKPGAFIPFSSGGVLPPTEDRERWFAEKNALLRKLREGKVSNGAAIEAELSNLSYEEFRNRYLQGRGKDDIAQYAGGTVAAVGHVGIVEIDSTGTPFVIEALWQPGVRRQNYSDWRNSRPGEIVWHGRVLNKTELERARIAAEAGKQVGKPYDFWNFDLSLDTGFYCSKLAWLSVFRATRMALDGNVNPLRSFWLSPKQILYSSQIQRLHDPGEYATD